MMRRLTKEDSDLLREAHRWDEGRPRWYREMDKVFFPGSAEDLVVQLDDRRKVFIGVFEEALTAIIIVERKDNEVFEGHLMARRKTHPELIALAIEQIMRDLVEIGMQEVDVWVAARNLGIRRLCMSIGLTPDGVVMYRGAYRGRVIKWLRHSIRREQLLMDKAA